MNTNKVLAEYKGKLRFLWLELTNQCNLRCIHCYAESGPSRKRLGELTPSDYMDVIVQAAALGCKQIQFIGGEPTLVKELPSFITHARDFGFTFVEVFTNLLRVPDPLLRCFVDNKVSIATSFYSDEEQVHEGITCGAGSYAATVANIRRVVNAGLDIRAGVILMNQNRQRVEETKAFLRSLGIKQIGTDRVRFLGRGSNLAESQLSPQLSELCGACWRGSLCVSPNGLVSPCIMSKTWSVAQYVQALSVG